MKKLALLLLLALFALPAFGQAPKVKHDVAPPIHSAKGVIASAWSKDHIKHPRGLKKTPRYKLLATPRFNPRGIKAPVQVLMIPPQLSMWGNDQFGDCVSASEAARKAAYSVFCGLPETFIPEATLIAWARAGGYLDGADLTTVMDDARTRGMVASDGKTYLDGPYTSVNFSSEADLQAALSLGPVNLGMDANALPSGAGNDQGWYAFGGSPGQFDQEDHCCALFGYGPTKVLFAALNVPVPANAPANGYLYYTWSTIGVVDHAWIMSTVGELYSQVPQTIGQSPTPIPPVPVPPTPAPDSPWTIVLNPDGTYTMTGGPPSGLPVTKDWTLKQLMDALNNGTLQLNPAPPKAKSPTVLPIDPPQKSSMVPRTLSPYSALITLKVPVDAVVTFDGLPTRQAGPVRTFDTPALAAGTSNCYVVSVDGQRREVWVSAGQSVAVDFTRTTIQSAIAPAPLPTLAAC